MPDGFVAPENQPTPAPFVAPENQGFVAPENQKPDPNALTLTPPASALPVQKNPLRGYLPDWMLDKDRPSFVDQVTHDAKPAGDPFSDAVEATGNALEGPGGTVDKAFGAIDRGMKAGLRPALVPMGMVEKTADQLAANRPTDQGVLSKTWNWLTGSATPEEQDAAYDSFVAQSIKEGQSPRPFDPSLSMEENQRRGFMTPEQMAAWKPHSTTKVLPDFSFMSEPSKFFEGLKTDPTLEHPEAPQTGVPTPEVVPTIKKALRIPNAADIHAALTGDTSGTMFEPNPDDPTNPRLKWLQAAAQGTDFTVNNALLSELPPFSMMHNGPLPEALTDQAARTEAVRNLGEGMTPSAAAQEFAAQTGRPAPAEIYKAGDWTPQEAEDFANPPLHARVAQGTVSLFGTPVPKAIAPLLEPLAPILKAINTPFFSAEDPRAINQVRQKVNEGAAQNDAQEIIRRAIMPIEAKLAASGLPAEAVSHIKNLHELFTDDHDIRTFDADGNPNPTNFPKRYSDDLLNLADERPDVYGQVKARFDSGSAHLSPQAQAAQAYASTLPPAQQFALVDIARDTAKLPDEVRQALMTRGVRSLDVPELNADIKDMPRKLFDLIEAIKAREATTPVLKPDGLDGAKGPVQALFDAATRELDVPKLSQAIEDARGAKPKPVPEQPGKFSMTPEPAADPLGVQSIADAVARKRALASGDMSGAVEPPDAFAMLDQLSRGELLKLKNAAYEKLAPAFEQINAVPNYAPGRVGRLSRMEMDKDANPNLRKPGVGMNPETLERGGTVASLGPEYDALGNVKKSTFETNQTAEKGTSATEGRSSLEKTPGFFARVADMAGVRPFYEKFLTATGIKEAQLAAGESFMSGDVLKAFRSDLEHMLPKAMSNAGIDAHVANTMQFPKFDSVQAVQKLIYDGVETGETAEKALPNYYHTNKGALLSEGSGKTGSNAADASSRANDFVASGPMSAGPTYRPGSPFESGDPLAERSPEPRGTMGPVDVGPWRSGMPGEGPTQFFARQAERAKFAAEDALDASKNPVSTKHPKTGDAKAFNSEQPHSGGLPPETPPPVATPSLKPVDPVEEAMNAARAKNPAKWQYDFDQTQKAFNPVPSNPFQPRTELNLGTNEPARFAPPVEETPVTSPPTLEDAQRLWNQLGEKGDFLDRMNQTAKDKIDAGVPFHEVVEPNWQPDNMAEVTLGNQHGYIHAGVARELSEYKRLGQDTIGIARWINGNAPAYAATLTQAKQWSTLFGPQFPAYMLLKQLHDQVRAWIGGLIDSNYPGEVWNGQKGWRDYARDKSIDTLPNYAGQNGQIVSGRDMAQIMESSGQTHAGTEFSDYENQQRAAQGQTTDPGFVAQKVQKLKDALSLNGDREVGQNLKQMIQGQDYANRAAGIAARLRAGDTPMEAGFKVNAALFDFSRKGPATQFLAASGAIPFMAWHAKVLPFMAQWIAQEPGQFLIVQHALQQLGAGQIPADQLPDYLRDKTNLTIKVTKDKSGHYQMTMANDVGVIPGDDVKNLASSLQKNFGVQWLLQHSGPALRLIATLKDQIAEDAKDDDKKTPADVADSLVNSMFNRPLKAVEDVTQPTADGAVSGWNVLNTLVNPMHAGTVDMTTVGNFSVQQAKSNVAAAGKAVANASAAVDQAKADVHAASVALSEAQILQTPYVQQKAQALQAAKARLQREQRTQAQVEANRERTDAWLEAHSRAP